MRTIRLVLLVILLLVQTPGIAAGEMLGRPEAEQLMRRISDLLEATRIVMPELSRAGAPLQETFSQGAKTLAASPDRNQAGVLYRMLLNARAYLHLSDTLPRPSAFAEDIEQQLASLRVAIQRFEAHFLAVLDGSDRQALSGDRDNFQRYQEDNRRAGPVQDEGPRVVFLGDSITDGWSLEQYFTGRPFYNRGISGQITGQMLGRTMPDVINLRPAVMVVLGGTNDLARGVSDSTIRSNLESIGMLAESANVFPIMASVLPVNDYRAEEHPRFRRTILRSPERIAGLNRWLKTTCSSRGWMFLDYHSAMVDADGRLRQDLSDDGLHPNEEGYKTMARVAQEAIDSALRVGPRRARRRAR